MFRCITELKGLVVDVDSIDTELNEWAWIFEKYQCVLLHQKRITLDIHARRSDINQKKGTYWSSTVPQVSCQECRQAGRIYAGRLRGSHFLYCKHQPAGIQLFC